MTTKYRILEPLELNPGIDFVSRDDVRVDLDSPATEIMHDFYLEPPLVIDERATVGEAQILMERAHRKFKMVVDNHDHFKGVLTYADLIGPQVVARASEMNVKPAELSIIEMMTPASFLHAVPYRYVRTASVGDVLVTLEHYGEQHLIVLQRKRIRGLILATDMAALTGLDLQVHRKPESMAEIVARSAH